MEYIRLSVRFQAFIKILSDHKSNFKVVDKQQEREKGKQFLIVFQKAIIESYVYHFQTLLFCTNSDFNKTYDPFLAQELEK